MRSMSWDINQSHRLTLNKFIYLFIYNLMVTTVVESTRRCQLIELYKALGQILFNKELN